MISRIFITMIAAALGLFPAILAGLIVVNTLPFFNAFVGYVTLTLVTCFAYGWIACKLCRSRWCVGAKWCCLLSALGFFAFIVSDSQQSESIVFVLLPLSTFFAADMGCRRKRLQQLHDYELEDRSSFVDSAHDLWNRL